MGKKFTARIVGFSEAYEMAYKVSRKIVDSSLNFDVVVGIARGGYPPARLVCDFLNIKTLTAIQIRHYTGGGKEKEKVEITDPLDIDLKMKNVLIVDDVNDSGKTLKAAVDHIKTKESATIKTAVLHEKDNTSLNADFVGDYLTEWKWFIYQWAVTEDLIEFLNEDDMLSAGEEEMRKYLSNKYKLEVSIEIIGKILAKKSRKMLDEAGLDYMEIAASNQIDEYVINSLLDQNAPIDLFGVGTSLVTGRPDSALDGVYKLSYANGEPRLKLSETVSKINLPGKKQVYRLLNKDGSFYGGEMVALADEENIEMMYHSTDPKKTREIAEFEKDPLLEKVVENGQRISNPRSVEEISAFSRQQLEKLPGEFKRFDNPHIYKIGLTRKLKKLRDTLVQSHKEKV